ncbi:MAG: DEAD/DEAH box helicase [Candidatus Aureabacteria bacterium]|nr:DEAD/DEAH box helicase [Candidatus Auribacterota bacterium]
MQEPTPSSPPSRRPSPGPGTPPPRPARRSFTGGEKPQHRKVIPPMPPLLPVPPAAGKTRFCDLDIVKEVVCGVQDLQFEYCTPIQNLCLPHLLAGKDVTGKAQTGTGKTAAFLAAIFTHLLRRPITTHAPGFSRALVLAPTRELAIQIYKDAEAIGKYCGLNNLVLFGGMGYQEQRNALKRPIDILVGTPGRIIDYSRSGHLHLSETEILVIDEADRMLDMGFIPDVRRIVSKLPPPGKRQTMFFSATLTPNIVRLVERWLVNPVTVESEPEQLVTGLIDQRFYAVAADEKFALLLWLLGHDDASRILVFCNRRDGCLRIARRLTRYGIHCGLLTGDVPQEKRLRILERFRDGETPVLVATDVAARGIHVESVSHVVNYDLPQDPEDYVHRIGRTGRAGEKGKSVAFVDEYGAYVIPAIEKLLGIKITCIPVSEDMVLLPPPPPHTPRTGRGYGERHGADRNTQGQSESQRPPATPEQEHPSAEKPSPQPMPEILEQTTPAHRDLSVEQNEHAPESNGPMIEPSKPAQ